MKLWAQLSEFSQLIEYASRLLVLRALQVGIRQIVHRMKLLIPAAGHTISDGVGLGRRLGIEIRMDRFLP